MRVTIQVADHEAAIEVTIERETVLAAGRSVRPETGAVLDEAVAKVQAALGLRAAS